MEPPWGKWTLCWGKGRAEVPLSPSTIAALTESVYMLGFCIGNPLKKGSLAKENGLNPRG